jgi:hypothetical protein
VGAVPAGPDKAGCATFSGSSKADIFRQIGDCAKDHDLVCVHLHHGREHFRYPRPEDAALKREMVDAGAQLVVGHHPHMLQGFEFYRERPVLHSIGNFFLPPIIDSKGRKQLRSATDRELAIPELVFEDGKPVTLGWRFGKVTRDYMVQLFDGPGQEAGMKFLQELSGPLAEDSYDSFWSEYLVKRERQLARSAVLKALRKLLVNNPVTTLRTISGEDLTRNFKRVIGSRN